MRRGSGAADALIVAACSKQTKHAKRRASEHKKTESSQGHKNRHAHAENGR